MKALFVMIAILSIGAAQAESRCNVKQKNAASLKLADTLGILVQEVVVVGIQPGMWTEAVGENVGSNTVTVRGTNARGLSVIEMYNVAAKQIGATDDCKVTKTSIARL